MDQGTNLRSCDKNVNNGDQGAEKGRLFICNLQAGQYTYATSMQYVA